MISTDVMISAIYRTQPATSQSRHSTRASIHLGGEQDQTNLRSKDGGEG